NFRRLSIGRASATSNLRNWSSKGFGLRIRRQFGHRKINRKGERTVPVSILKIISNHLQRPFVLPAPRPGTFDLAHLVFIVRLHALFCFGRVFLAEIARPFFLRHTSLLPFAAAAFAFRALTLAAAHRFRCRRVAAVDVDGQPATYRRAESKFHKRRPAFDPFRRTSLDSSTPSSRNW